MPFIPTAELWGIAIKINRQNKIELDQAKKDIINANTQAIAEATTKLERCINERIQVDSRGKQHSSFCEGILEDAKRFQNASSNYIRGLSKATLGDLDGAEAEFDEAIELQRPILSEYYFQRGNIRFLKRKYKDACIDYTDATKANSKHVDAWKNKGLVLYILGRYDEAIQAFDEALRLDPQDAYAWDDRDHALYSLGRNDEAIQAFEKAIELDPELDTAWGRKGNALSKQNKFEEAIQAYEKATELDPQNVSATLTWRNKVPVFRPQNATVWGNKALALHSLGRDDEAIQAFEKAIELDPDGMAWWK